MAAAAPDRQRADPGAGAGRRRGRLREGQRQLATGGRERAGHAPQGGQRARRQLRGLRALGLAAAPALPK
eukprot:10109989-Alexandrium_andersonii.AAC.1